MRDPGCDNDSVSPTPAQQARAAAIAAEITARLADVSFALPGTLADRMTRCGHPGCRCHADPPQRHGPYHQWTRKKNGKTATRILTDDQLADYGPWFDNHRRCANWSPSSRNSASPSPRPTPAGTASQAARTRARPAGRRNRNNSLQIVWAARRLTCGRHASQSPFAQVSPKREDLTTRGDAVCPFTCGNGRRSGSAA